MCMCKLSKNEDTRSVSTGYCRLALKPSRSACSGPEDAPARPAGTAEPNRATAPYRQVSRGVRSGRYAKAYLRCVCERPVALYKACSVTDE